MSASGYPGVTAQNNTWKMYGFTQTASGSMGFQNFGNALVIGNVSDQFGSGLASGPNGLRLGGGILNTGSGFTRSFMAELLVYSAPLSFSLRQDVEGYLARRYGFSNNLPLGHPFNPIKVSNSCSRNCYLASMCY
jgi:hypothetical protein